MRYWSRRLRVGRSSESVFGAVPSGLASTGPFVLPGARRRRGLFGSSGVSTLRRLWSISRRCFTSLNSEVFTTYSGLATRIFWISSWEALMRSSVGGCEEKTLAMVPPFFHLQQIVQRGGRIPALLDSQFTARRAEPVDPQQRSY